MRLIYTILAIYATFNVYFFYQYPKVSTYFVALAILGGTIIYTTNNLVKKVK